MRVLCEAQFNLQENQEICVNDFAPSSENVTLFFKRVTDKKSDGSVAVFGQKVLVIDSGREDDYGVLNYLLELRETWLSEYPQLIENERAKLVVQMVITHAHGDHMPAVFHLVRHPFLRVKRVYAPPRAALADTDKNPLLTQCEDQFVILKDELQCYGHTSAQIVHLTFGEHRIVSWGENSRMDLFAPPFDWSDGEGYAVICEENERFADKVTYECNGILNNNSIWMKLTVNGQTVLFTGDQRDNSLATDHMMQFHGVDEFKCDVLTYIHHGGRRYSKYLSDVTQPAITIFTDVNSNIFPQALEDANHYGTAYRTEEGNLILRLDGKNISVQSNKDRRN